LAEIGTLHLEFSELTAHFGDPSYLQKVTTVRDVLQNTPREHDKLYPVYIHPTTKQWGQKLVSVGALGDSFYEYLIKERLNCSTARGILSTRTRTVFSVLRGWYSVSIFVYFSNFF
jgi:hypothetical protein